MSLETTRTAATAIVRSAAITTLHTTLRFAITPRPTPHGRAATGQNTAQTAVRISVQAQATVRPIRLGMAVIGMNIAATVGSLWIPAQVTATVTEAGNITTAPDTAAPELVPPAAQRLILMATIPPAPSIHSTAAPSTAMGAIAPPARPMSARSATQIIISATEAGRITTAHSIDGSKPVPPVGTANMNIPVIHCPMGVGQTTLRHNIDARLAVPPADTTATNTQAIR